MTQRRTQVCVWLHAGVYQLNYNQGTNTYTVFNQARTTCKGVLSGYRCGVSINVFGYTGVRAILLLMST